MTATKSDDTEVIKIPYKPRKQFAGYHARKQRFAAMVCHRRAGKTVAVINDLIKEVLSCPLPRPRGAYVAPTYGQAARVAWDYLVEFTAPIPGVKVNKSTLSVELPNGARISLYGADNPDSLRGIYLDALVLDEFAEMDPRVWREVLRPACADRKARVTFIGTPKGTNHLYRIWTDANGDPENWFAFVLRASESGILDPEELEAARKDMSKEEFAQEFECSFEAAIQGSYYGDYIADARDEGRITKVPFRSDLRVHTVWDLGHSGESDATAIILYQRVGGEVHIPRYIEFERGDLTEIVARLEAVQKAHKFLWGTDYLPHDAWQNEIGTGRSRAETLELLGRKDQDKVAKLKVMDGINAGRTIFSRCWFDEQGASELVEALIHYHARRNEKKEHPDPDRRFFEPKPHHDWSSHGADAFRYLAISLERPKPRGKERIRSMGGMSAPSSWAF